MTRFSRLAAAGKLAYLGAHTASRMRPRQLLGTASRKLRETVVPRLVDLDDWYDDWVPADPSVRLDAVGANTATLRAAVGDATRARSRRRATAAADGAVTFLNRTRRIADGDRVAWDDDRLDDLPALWALQLYAFRPFRWAVVGVGPDEPAADRLGTAFDDWLVDWIDRAAASRIGRPGYLRRTWTPWSVSLRILAWCRYLAWRGDADRRVRRALYKNARFLRRNVEWDVDGNHLVENAAALVAAGVVCERPEWVDAGRRVATAVADQFRADGFHYELSPMYHVVVVTRLLTVRDLLARTGRDVPGDLDRALARGVAFLRHLRPPDDRIPLTNDAVYGQSLPLVDCLSYAARVGPPAGNDPPAETDHRWLDTSFGRLLIDGGPIGPPHLPGHSHADPLNLLVWLGDRRLVTDTGTFAYTNDDRRSHARGVAAHNTVQVGETNPVAVGGTYLMGPRPTVRLRARAGDVSLVEGCYRARPYREPGYGHHRVVYATDDWWLVRDTVVGDRGRPVRARFHLHPSVTPRRENGEIRLVVDDREAAVVPVAGSDAVVGRSDYYPRFGLARDRPVVTVRADDSPGDAATVTTLLTTPPVGTPQFRRTPAGHSLSTGDGVVTLPPPRLRPG